ncbi:hypothetical protein DFA_09161 [Cavenderia fasciculata]|uniref:Uncharacterized protein n=1 Tax=Cavenderia fasciculata TaxID=261658 RepID=F4Q6V4_CACFS|nr:uncharacterized protein DFA_09161 [Cavenderia fasciculata]EGG16136.1 hypothetical protein DFA_09161 [Cavenderia fasciculata]|eukprot:XP_004352589.1 hypothetical protein DFA_09161 [Cavenderia fasciculata]
MTNRGFLLRKINGKFERIQSNCPHHGWVDISSLYVTSSRVTSSLHGFSQKSIYRLRLSKLSIISKSTRSFVLNKLMTKFGPTENQGQLLEFNDKPFIKKIKRLSTTIANPVYSLILDTKPNQLTIPDLFKDIKSIKLPTIQINIDFPFKNPKKC